MKFEPETLLARPEITRSPIDKTRLLPFLLLAAVLAWLVGWYWETLASIEATWARSKTFQHGYLVVPISAWLIWQRRHSLAQVPLVPTLGPVAFLIALGFGWLLADLAEVVVVRQYGVVLMIPVIVATLLGKRFARAIAFPLAFLVLAVPVGEILIDPMMKFTADFTVAALRLTGIPVYREGMNFSLPSGNWSVVEACSGIRYLIAAITLGCLYSYLTYRSVKRRVVFMALSAVVPVLANGLRAYMIVMIGHLSDMRLAIGIDHLIYGWIFFGIVMALLFWIGSIWREDVHPEPSVSESQPLGNGPVSLPRLMTAALCCASAIALWPAYGGYLEASHKLAPVALRLEEVPNWQITGRPMTEWQPHYQNPRAQLHTSFRKDGQSVGLFIGYYNHQTETVKLVSYANDLTTSEDRRWRAVNGAKEAINIGREEIAVRRAALRGGDESLHVLSWYWVEGVHTANPYLVKLIQAKSRLIGNGDDSAVIVIYAKSDGAARADRVVRDFIRDALPAIEQSLNDANRD